jgi:SAM-dependent methyltransferase
VEAKKPSVHIDSDPGPAFQLRRYAWSATLPLSILTDFEEFAVYDTRIRPHAKDRASTARILYLRCAEYEQRWEEIQELFSRDAILRGAFDSFADSARSKRGTTAVDEAFLAELNEWREVIAKHLASSYRRMNEATLNDAVQLTLNRLLFLRIAEDRGLEPYGALREAAGSGDAASAIAGLFARAHDRYNSGLFARDRRDDRLALPEKAIRVVVGRMYYPHSPYEFSVMPLDVLGHAYEQFLGKHLRLTPARRVRVEDKPLVRKAGGVFYTPDDVVSYIVRTTIAPLLQERGAGARPLRVLDPACGSGSFLTAAYELLLDHAAGGASSGATKAGAGGDTAARIRTLSLSEKRQVLTTHLFGVDIDPHAVEVAKLSLLLRLVEGESSASVQAARDASSEKALPDLASRLKCGNSLVQADYFGLGLTETADEVCSVNPFDWRSAFPDVFSGERPGFDVIIGNPPYVSLQSGFLEPEILKYLQSRYGTFERISDYFALFLERALALLADGGVCGMIVPSTLLSNLSFRKLRGLLLTTATVTDVVLLGDGVFRDAVVPTCIVVFRKAAPADNIVELGRNVVDLRAGQYDRTQIRQESLRCAKDFCINVDQNPEAEALASRLRTGSSPLQVLVNIKEGIKTGDDGRFLSEKPFPRQSHPVVKGRDVERYSAAVTRYIHYVPDELDRPQTPDHFLAPQKLLLRRVGDRLTATFDDQQLFCVHTLYTVRPRNEQYSLKFLLGLLNSTLLTYLYRAANPQKGKVFPEIRIHAVNSLPIPASVPDHLVQDVERAVDTILECHAQRLHASTEHQREVLSRKASALDERIDELVFRIYGLSGDEMRLVAAHTSGARDDGHSMPKREAAGVTA